MGGCSVQLITMPPLEEAIRAAIETGAQYDGKRVLRTNTRLSFQEAALAYK